MYTIQVNKNGNYEALHTDLPTYDSAWGMLEIMSRYAKKERKRVHLGKWQLHVNETIYEITNPYDTSV